MYELKPISPRIQKIRAMYRDLEPQINLSRYKLLTEFYQTHTNLNGPLKRALAYKHICDNLDIDILDHEIIVGGHAPTFRGSALFPENDGGAWMKDEFTSDFVQTRDVDPYVITDEDKQYVLDTVDFWCENCTSQLIWQYMPPTYKDYGGSMVVFFDQTAPPAGAPIGHFMVGHQRILDRGMQQIRDEAWERMEQMTREGIYDRISQYQFYRCVTIVLDGAMNLAQRYSDLAAKKAEECTDPERKKELELIRDTMARVPRFRPRTYLEACQCVYFYQMCVTLDAQMHGTSFGRVDQYLGPFYEADLKAGRITPEQGQEITDHFIMKVAEQNKAISYYGAKSGPGYTSGQLITIGGVDRHGDDATNDVTYMLLQSSGRLILHSPPVALRVHAGTPDALWEAGIETTRRVGGVPSFESDEAIVPAMMNAGMSLEDARNYGMVGCVEPGGCGTEWTQAGGDGGEAFVMLPNAMLLAINNGTNPMRFPGAPEPKQSGPSTGYLYEMQSFEEVKDAFKEVLQFFAKLHIDNTASYQYVMRWNQPVTIASVGIEGCMESGRDVMNEGAKYTGCGNTAVGIGNMADSLAAIKYLCFDKKLCTTREFYDALMANWQGELGERIHNLIIKEVPHFGNGDPYVDELAKWGVEAYHEAFNGKKVLNGTTRCGLWPVTAHIALGSISYATPDGRYCGEAYSDGISGVQGRDANGPTGVFASVSNIDCTKFGNGTLLNMKFSPSALVREDSRGKLADLMRTYMIDMKGMEMQINVVSSDTMKDAREHPEEYKDLVVRIAGFSAYFVEISEEAKDDLIKRTTMEEV